MAGQSANVLPDNRPRPPVEPAPAVPAVAAASAAPAVVRCVDASTDLERALGEIFAEVAQLSRVSVNSHFFNDLDADSLRMAHFCARIRKSDDLPSISMKDVYKHSTIRSLAKAIAPEPSQPRRPARPLLPEIVPVSRRSYLLCGALQLMFFLGAAYLGAFVLVRGFEWISTGEGWVNVYERAVVFSLGSLAAYCLLPILAKWMLIGRWKPAQIRLWSLTYLRFWLVKTLMRTSPMVLFVGSPLYLFYLRALGAKIGRGVVILSRHVPLCTDLLTIGANTVIRKESYFNGYRAHAGVITTGRISLGARVFVGENTVIDINTRMGDGSQLGHSSSLHPGQTVPPQRRWHGCPARPSRANYQTVPPAHRVAARRFFYSVWQVLRLALFGPPMLAAMFTVVEVMLGSGFTLPSVPRPGVLGVHSATYYAEVLLVAIQGFFISIFLGLLAVGILPRMLRPLLPPDRLYPLYGIRYWVHRTITRMTNIKFFQQLYGDSSYITGYLRWAGYDLGRPVVQSGSNFGSELKHDNSHLTKIGTGTMIADGLSVINAGYSHTSFGVREVSIGPDNYFGNHIAYPVGGRTGANCLLATKVAVPLFGPVRQGVGLLGSPAFEIPRSVERDSRFDHLHDGEEFRIRLRAKNLHNQATMGLFLLTRLIHFLVLVALAALTADLYRSVGVPVVAAAGVVGLAFTTLYWALVERAATRFRRLEPKFCSIYQYDFWRHERYWKLTTVNYLAPYSGTPFAGFVLRLGGGRVGKRLYDDGAAISEKSMATIGDDVTLNANAKIQAHSQEDGTFKSDYITIGNGCTLGVSAMVHYGTELGHDSVLETDGFLMKGEQISPRTRWVGNPATELR
ncbi:hypothetical protein GCM10023321_08110 [Pseudonocardia eucalypti]|uniref:Carrier domain-containing protein n=1 Tax=Pseudonocardia eucalypti TaxID=648755 RepID=A0ABP9PJT4_9PSEU|nr:non-ribosomal peptide synthetase-like protein [Pseudonocardia eucalypti]